MWFVHGVWLKCLPEKHTDGHENYDPAPLSLLTLIPLSHWSKIPLEHAQIGFCGQCECVNSAFTSGSVDSAVDPGFYHQLLSGVLKTKKFDFPAVKIPGSQTELTSGLAPMLLDRVSQMLTVNKPSCEGFYMQKVSIVLQTLLSQWVCSCFLS